MAALRRRSAKPIFAKVKGHSEDKGNEAADQEAKKEANKPAPTMLNLNIPPELKIHGLRL